MSTSQDFNIPQSNDGRMLRLLASGWIFLLLLVLICIFTGLRPSQFASAYNMQQLAINAALILVLAAGQTYVIIAAGIDLSIGSVLVFCSVVSAQVMLALSGDSGTTFGTTSAGWGVILIGVFASIITGILWGLLNGFLVSVAKIPALIVTLARWVWHWAGPRFCPVEWMSVPCLSCL